MPSKSYVDYIAGVLHDAYSREVERQGYYAPTRWPLVAQDHARRWRAAARAVIGARSSVARPAARKVTPKKARKA